MTESRTGPPGSRGDPGARRLEGHQREIVQDQDVHTGQLGQEPGEDPPFGDLHGAFHLGLVARRRRPGWEDRGAVMRPELGEPALQPGLVGARDSDAGFQLITHDGPSDPAKIHEHPRVAPEPVGELLRRGCFGVGVVAGPQDPDEEFHVDDSSVVGSMRVGFCPA